MSKKHSSHSMQWKCILLSLS